MQVRRGTDLVEAEFVGRSHGHEFREFLLGIDPALTVEQKMGIWRRQLELEQAKLLYSKVGHITMFPPNSDLKMFQFGGSGDGPATREIVKSGVLAGIAATQHGGRK